MYQILKTAMIISAVAALMVGCASSGEGGQETVIDRLEFEEGETGCVRANGNISVGGNPFAQSEVSVIVVKTQGDDPPDC